MSADTVLSNVVHLPGSYLYLEGYSVSSYDRSMKRAVHIGLRRRDIVLESSGNRLEHLVYKTEGCVALKLGIHDYSHRVEVVYLVKALALIEHLAIDTVN